MAVEIDVVYRGNLICECLHEPSGQTLRTDAPVDNGGQGSQFSPTDLVATGMGACMLTIMGIVAQRAGLDITGARVHVVKHMTTQPPRRIAELRTVITLPEGHSYSAEDRKKLEQAAMTCPVKGSLHPDIHLDIEFVYPE